MLENLRKHFAVLHDCLLYDNEKSELKIVTVFFYYLYLASFFFSDSAFMAL